MQTLPFAGLVLTLACVLAAGVDQYLTPAYFAAYMGSIAAWVEASQGLAALGFVLVTAGAFAIALPSGASLLAIAAGALFGLWIGTGLYVAGATCGSVALFLAARPAVGGWIRRKGREGGGSAARLFRREALWIVLSLRLIPPVPAAIVTLAAAGGGAAPRGFVAATAIGLAPGAVLLAYMGSMLVVGAAPNEQALWRWPELGLLLGLSAMAIAPVLVRLWWHRQAEV